MEEKIIKGKKNGFAMMILLILLYAGALLLTIVSAIAIDHAEEPLDLQGPWSIMMLIIMALSGFLSDGFHFADLRY